MMINSSVQAIFPIIKFYAQIAHGHPMIIDSVEPPPQGVVSDARIQGFYSNPDDSSEIDFRYGDLTLLPFKESEKLKDWDGKPVFIENGKMVRPHVAVIGCRKIILKRKDDLVPRLGISVDAYPNGASVFPKEVVEGASSSSERIQMIPLFNEKLIEGSSVNLTEEKKEAP